MVEEHELQKEKIQEDYNDKYWDQRYTVVQQQIPSFLQKMADKILSTGRCFFCTLGQAGLVSRERKCHSALPLHGVVQLNWEQ